MKWHKKPNVIVALIVSLAYTIVTLMNVIGPLHMNGSGGNYQLSQETTYSLVYWVIALIVTWGLFFILRNKPKLQFFTLIVLGIVIIIAEVFLWGVMK